MTLPPLALFEKFIRFGSGILPKQGSVKVSIFNKKTSKRTLAVIHPPPPPPPPAITDYEK